MRILFTTSNDMVPWGGSEELWYKTAMHAANEGNEVAISVAWNPLPAKLDVLRAKNHYSFIDKKIVSGKFNKFLPGRFRVFKELYKKDIIKWKPDIAVVSQGNNADGIELMNFFFTHDIPYISISQAVYEGIWPDIEKSAKMMKVYTNACKNFFVSEANKKVTELMVAKDIPKSSVIRNPFNVPYETNFDFPYINQNYQLACVARYEFYAKGQDVLLEVLSQKKWKERNLVVNFYGNGFNKSALTNLIQYFNLQNAVVNEFTLPVEIWKKNHGLVLPSRFEGLPLALVEAMLCGRFGIVSNVSGNREVFIDGVSGFLAEAPKAEYIDLAMERAWSRKDEWENIGKNAQSYIKQLVPEYPEIVLYNEIYNCV